jgi:NADH dehydrogenase FAD-containing subunit/uncharacterized membrane protein YphA (DoxX/SURF4 family)
MSSRSLRSLRRLLNLSRSILVMIFPIVDALARIGAGKTFLVSGMLRVGDWPIAMELSRPEYALGWLDPAVELTASILFMLGLLTRATAALMLGLSLAAQFSYRMADAHLLWAALFAWYVVFGAGPISVDAAIAGGLRDGPLPFADRAMVLAETISTRFGPPFKAALRVWLALAIVGVASSSWLPVDSFASPSKIGSWVVAVLLGLGLGTPLVSGALALICAGASMMVGASLFYASLLFLLLAFSGAGRWSLDAWLRGLVERPPMLTGRRQHVVIVGAGFGGMRCASGLKNEAVDVTLIDRNNYHLFQPLLYQVATAGLSPADIAFPIRALFRDNRAIRVLRGTVTGVNAARRTVMVDGREIGYDHLVLATGATHGYFGHEEWSVHAPGLKHVEDAIAIRARVLSAFERAEAAIDPADRMRLLTFVICGAGPTGVELAGAIADLAHFGLSDEFRSIDPTSARVVLVQAGPRVLPTFPENLSLAAQASLEKMGVEVRLNSRMEKVDADGVLVNGEAISAGTTLWAAGVVASPVAQWLGQEPDSTGRLQVGPDLSVPGHPEIFGIGDTVSVAAWNGRQAPGLAPAAKQAGAYVAEALCARIYGDPPPPPFHYRHWGSLATIGRKSAVVDLGRLTRSGAVAWWFWGTVHLLLVVGLRNRASVFLGWIWSYATYRVGVQLITGLPVVEAAAQRPVNSRAGSQIEQPSPKGSLGLKNRRRGKMIGQIFSMRR